MTGRRSLGRQFGWLWGAYAVSAYGSGFGFGAFALVAIRVLHAGPGEVSALSAAGLAAGAAGAGPLRPGGGVRRQRPGVGFAPRRVRPACSPPCRRGPV